MFDKLKKELEKLEQMKSVSVPIEADKDGYFDRECPNEECFFQFKVDEKDWKNLLKDEQVFCPLCRHEAPAKSWIMKEQLEMGMEQVDKHIQGVIHKAIVDDAKDFNSRQNRNSFISMLVNVSGTKPYHYILPISSKDEMQLKIQCIECQAKYAVIGSAFFCPCCGHNSADETFDNSLKNIESKLKYLPVIKSEVAKISKDEAETTCRSLIETSLSECVVAFQRFCQVTYSKKFPTTKIKSNAFQNLEIGGKYWKDLTNETYSDWLTSKDFIELSVLFQKRHLLSHTEGMVDQKYIDKSGDKTYIVGQRIVVKEDDVLTLIKLIKTIVGTLRQK